MADEIKNENEIEEMVDEAIEKKKPLKKVVLERAEKVPRKDRKQFLKDAEANIAREITACEATIRTLAPDDERYAKAVANMKILTESYAALTKSKDEFNSKILAGVISGGISLAGTLLVCAFEKRGGMFLGKGLSKVPKP